MQLLQMQAQLQRKLKSALASGLNAAADRALVDIVSHVAVKTGRLRDSYAIAKRATPDRLEIEVASPLDYRIGQYPYIKRSRGSTPPLLGSGKFGEIVKSDIEQAINREFK